MEILQNLIQSYLQSAGYNLLDIKEGFIVADKWGLGGDRDTRLLWILPAPVRVKNFQDLERHLIRDFESVIPQYPNSTYSIVVYTLEGLSRDFRSEAARLGVKLRVPVQFFDAPYRIEDAPQAASAINTLRDPEPVRKRVTQPYSILIDGETSEHGEDLLPYLLNEIIGDRVSSVRRPCLRVVIGPAGAGKTVLFNSLFARLYNQFLDNKRKLQDFPRPVPLIPDYLRQASTIRTEALIDGFLRADVAAPVPPVTFEWMLVHGYCTWLFDGLDELYAGDPDFFDHLLDLLTQPESQAQILICARNSLLTTCENFAYFLREFPPGPGDTVRVYRLEDWEYPSKRAFAWLSFEGKLPRKSDSDSPQVAQFLTAITKSDSLKSLSGLPYFCDLLIGEFKQGTLKDFSDDFTLIDHAISGIIKREIDKGLLKQSQLEENGLTEWLETVAMEFFGKQFKGLAKVDMESYAHIILRAELSSEEQRNALTTLTQFPLFSPGVQTGFITFKHELIAEFLAGRYFLKRVATDPAWVGRALGELIDFSDSLIARYMASQLPKQQGGIGPLIETLVTKPLLGRAFSNLLQLLLLSNPARDIIRKNKIDLEGKDLRYVKFISTDLHNISLRNCNLSSTVFNGCDMQNTLFEGAIFCGTRFEQLCEEFLKGARFGNLDRFDFIYVGKQKIDDLRKMMEWLQKATGVSQKIKEPCPSALQLSTLFLKFVNHDGSGRRSELLQSALTCGKRYPGAPSPEDCVDTCRRFGYIEGPDFRGRMKRVSGDRYNDMVSFVKDWKLNRGTRQLLNSLCPKQECAHVPE